MIRAYVLLLLRGYKAFLSPMLPNACRFVPTCSEYASEAVERYGAVRGGLKAAWRLLRCHPLSAGGYDPVMLPEKPAGVPAIGQVWAKHSCPCSADHPALADAAPNPQLPNLRHDVWRC